MESVPIKTKQKNENFLRNKTEFFASNDWNWTFNNRFWPISASKRSRFLYPHEYGIRITASPLQFVSTRKSIDDDETVIDPCSGVLNRIQFNAMRRTNKWSSFVTLLKDEKIANQEIWIVVNTGTEDKKQTELEVSWLFMVSQRDCGSWMT